MMDAFMNGRVSQVLHRKRLMARQMIDTVIIRTSSLIKHQLGIYIKSHPFNSQAEMFLLSLLPPLQLACNRCMYLFS